ncbi:MAG: hypothetical protein NTU43_06235 [Bacteroidetes bacterium]|nr:hypothetical protein [Bacteroidota bacterium]
MDLKSYFEDEISRLCLSNYTLEKTLLFDGETEQKNTKKVDWKKEIEPFLDLDIHKNTYTGRLIADTILLSQDEFEVLYIPNDSSLDLKQLHVQFMHQKINGIKAEFASHNPLYHSYKLYEYFPDSLYLIEGNQKVKLVHSPSYSAIGRIIKK